MIILVIMMILLGEICYIQGEMNAAGGKWVMSVIWNLMGIPLLSIGYWMGYKGNGIWMMTITSIASIVIAEPIIGWIVFREVPGRNVIIGMGLSILALLIAAKK